MILRNLIAIALIFSFGGPALSERLVQLNGQRVEVSGILGEKILRIGGTAVLKDWDIEALRVVDIGETEVLIAYSTINRRDCLGTHFLVTIENGKPKTYIPRTCRDTEYTVEKDQIVITTKPLPTTSEKSWVWTPETGFVLGDDITFQEGSDLSWDDLVEQTPTRPFELFYFPEIKSAIEFRLRNIPEAERDRFNTIIKGQGVGRMDGQNFIGTACIRATCDDDRAFIFVDGITENVFLAWMDTRGDIRQAPTKGYWPIAARDALKGW